MDGKLCRFEGGVLRTDARAAIPVLWKAFICDTCGTNATILVKIAAACAIT
jgi:hypothetical protein